MQQGLWWLRNCFGVRFWGASFQFCLKVGAFNSVLPHVKWVAKPLESLRRHQNQVENCLMPFLLLNWCVQMLTPCCRSTYDLVLKKHLIATRRVVTYLYDRLMP